MAACVEELPRSSPPSSPTPGTCYLVGSSPTGAWSGFGDHIAAFAEGGWRFVVPREGLQALVRPTQSMAQFRGGVWHIGAVTGSTLVLGGQQVVAGRGAAVARVAGGSVVDTEARAAIHAILDRLEEHGLIALP